MRLDDLTPIDAAMAASIERHGRAPEVDLEGDDDPTHDAQELSATSGEARKRAAARRAVEAIGAAERAYARQRRDRELSEQRYRQRIHDFLVANPEAKNDA